jgi:hypothetical protein
MMETPHRQTARPQRARTVAQHENVESDLECGGIGDLSVRCLSAGRSMSRRAPVIVRDESSQLFLDAALQQSPLLHRPSLIVDQLGCCGQEKSVLEHAYPSSYSVPWLRLTPPKMAPFFTGPNSALSTRGKFKVGIQLQFGSPSCGLPAAGEPSRQEKEDESGDTCWK